LRVTVLERCSDFDGIARGVGLALCGAVVVVAVRCLWLQVRWWRRRARRRWRRRWRLGFELLVGAALHVAKHKRDALARLVGSRRL
jgi:hypothetical protein